MNKKRSLRSRYTQLTFWNKIAFWGSIASILSLLIIFAQNLFNNNVNITPPIPIPDYRKALLNSIAEGYIILESQNPTNESINTSLETIKNIDLSTFRKSVIPYIKSTQEIFSLAANQKINQNLISFSLLIKLRESFPFLLVALQVKRIELSSFSSNSEFLFGELFAESSARFIAQIFQKSEGAAKNINKDVCLFFQLALIMDTFSKWRGIITPTHTSLGLALLNFNKNEIPEEASSVHYYLLECSKAMFDGNQAIVKESLDKSFQILKELVYTLHINDILSEKFVEMGLSEDAKRVYKLYIVN